MAAILFKLLFPTTFYLFFSTMPARGAGMLQAGDHGCVVESKNRHDAVTSSATSQPIPS
ncbi:hypothetical protein [Novacetimonas maltaceti]|uniref:hypothetical protein n=1 Tax=Novacetimonas maltaceti TaxID=1203393 RepID=UPI00142DC40D|nr:hypothetical protein [Novacetimonas maltaceti]